MKPSNIFLATLKKKAGFPMEERAETILKKAGIPIERDDRGYMYVKAEDEDLAIEALRLRGNFGAAAADRRGSRFNLVRDINTGRKFFAEYSSEAAEWYEKGTGKAYKIGSVEIVDDKPEEPEETCVEIHS